MALLVAAASFRMFMLIVLQRTEVYYAGVMLWKAGRENH